MIRSEAGSAPCLSEQKRRWKRVCPLEGNQTIVSSPAPSMTHVLIRTPSSSSPPPPPRFSPFTSLSPPLFALYSRLTSFLPSLLAPLLHFLHIFLIQVPETLNAAEGLDRTWLRAGPDPFNLRPVKPERGTVGAGLVDVCLAGLSPHPDVSPEDMKSSQKVKTVARIPTANMLVG